MGSLGLRGRLACDLAGFGHRWKLCGARLTRSAAPLAGGGAFRPACGGRHSHRRVAGARCPACPVAQSPSGGSPPRTRQRPAPPPAGRHRRSASGRQWRHRPMDRAYRPRRQPVEKSAHWHAAPWPGRPRSARTACCPANRADCQPHHRRRTGPGPAEPRLAAANRRSGHRPGAANPGMDYPAGLYRHGADFPQARRRHGFRASRRAADRERHRNAVRGAVDPGRRGHAVQDARPYQPSGRNHPQGQRHHPNPRRRPHHRQLGYRSRRRRCARGAILRATRFPTRPAADGPPALASEPRLWRRQPASRTAPA